MSRLVTYSLLGSAWATILAAGLFMLYNWQHLPVMAKLLLHDLAGPKPGQATTLIERAVQSGDVGE